MTRTKPRVWADIDLDALARNLEWLGRKVGGTRRVLLVVKADAYGHGAVAVARFVCSRVPVAGFGVGDSGEALELREAGIDAPILVLGAIVDGEMPRVVAHDIAVTVHSFDRIRRLEAEARRQGRRCRVHVMVDTGMGRLGPFPEKALELARAVHRSERLVLEGIATHFSSSHRPRDPFTDEQIRRFEQFRRDLAAAGIGGVVAHAANSGAVLERGRAGFDLVRVGAAAYGLTVRSGEASDLQPVLQLKTQVIYLKDVPAGTPVSYERRYVTPRRTRIATLPIGYDDGLRYALSNRFDVLVKGRRAPIVGAVSMDYTMIDVGHIPGVRAGDVVTVLGRDGEEEVRVPDMAEAIGTVPYEITCALGRRVRRVYHPRPRRPALGETLKEAAVRSRGG